MPRKALSPELACIQARRRLETWLNQQGMTPTELSMRVDCNQSTVQRFLASRTKTITPAVRKMLEYAGIDEKDCINASVKNAFDNAHIRQALGQVWDGNDASAQKLAKLIVTIAPLIGLDRSTAN